MNKDIVKCISTKIKEEQELKNKINDEKNKKWQQEISVKKQIIKEIEDFFYDLPRDKSYIFQIAKNNYIYRKDFWGRETDIIEKNYVESLIIPNTKPPFNYLYMHISFIGDSIYIGFSDRQNDYRRYWSGNLSTYMEESSLRYVRDNLGWFETELAKQFGCSK